MYIPLMHFSGLVRPGRSCCSFWKWIINSMCCKHGCSGDISRLCWGNAYPNYPLLDFVFFLFLFTSFSGGQGSDGNNIQTLLIHFRDHTVHKCLFNYVMKVLLDRHIKFLDSEPRKYSFRIWDFYFSTVIQYYKCRVSSLS